MNDWDSEQGVVFGPQVWGMRLHGDCDAVFLEKEE